jgi:hypothetical protein
MFLQWTLWFRFPDLERYDDMALIIDLLADGQHQTDDVLNQLAD